MLRSRSSGLLTAKQRARFIVGLVGLGLTLGYGVKAATTLSLGQPDQPGDAVFPLIVAGLMAIASLALIREQLSPAADARDGSLGLPHGSDRHRLLGTALGYVAYIALVPFLGHLLASSLLALVLVRLLRPGPWPSTILTALAISGASYMLFVLILEVPLPKGFFG